MARASKATLSNQKVPARALQKASYSKGRTDAQKLASVGHGLLRVDEAAIHLNVSPKSVRRLIKAEALSVIRIGRLVRIQRSEIERFFAAATSATDKLQNLEEDDGHE